MYFYVFSIIVVLSIFVIVYLLRMSFLYLYSIQSIAILLILFLLFLLLNIRYIEFENSGAVLSIKEYHPISITMLPKLYRQVEIPLTEIYSTEIQKKSQKLLLSIKSNTTGKIITKVFILQYLGDDNLQKINDSLKYSSL
ncbi:magnesium-transporting ATPase (P-type) [Chryseobacterium jejuense]|nr:magnesium-transporting ATPase (P-type) [Chryseobacterium jejuense]